MIREKPYHHARMAQSLHLTMEGTNPLTMPEWLWISALISDMEGTNPLTMTKWLLDSSLPLGRDLDLENTKLLPEVLKIHYG